MAVVLRVPEVATGSTEAVLTEWLVPENTPFEAGAALAVLETDKAAVEVEAESSAVLLRHLVHGGSTVEVGAPIAVLGAAGEDVSTVLAELDSAPHADDRRSSRPDRAGDRQRFRRDRRQLRRDRRQLRRAGHRRARHHGTRR
jgi:pyruvate/2-oxoglutarate dehydrogenase complex dihydrolipoamide acyltransferase (E2) component